MPNWCYNSVNFWGDKKNIRKMKSIVENNGDEANMFEKLIGRDDSISDEKFNDGGWYDHNIARYGTKWDVDKKGFDFPEETGGSWSDDTAWSPPMEFWRRCSEVYKLKVEMYYEEPGGDFCGKCEIEEGNIVSEQDYTYQGGIYEFEGYSEWYDREWESYGRESFVEDIESMAEQDGKMPSRKDVIEYTEEWYDFLKDNEREELVDEVMKELYENFKLDKDATDKQITEAIDARKTKVEKEKDELPF